MAGMPATEAAVDVMKKDRVHVVFGVPRAAINPLYAALRKRGGIRHILARHVESAKHMAQACIRAKTGNLGVCIGTYGPT